MLQARVEQEVPYHPRSVNIASWQSYKSSFQSRRWRTSIHHAAIFDQRTIYKSFNQNAIRKDRMLRYWGDECQDCPQVKANHGRIQQSKTFRKLSTSLTAWDGRRSWATYLYLWPCHQWVYLGVGHGWEAGGQWICHLLLGILMFKPENAGWALLSGLLYERITTRFLRNYAYSWILPRTSQSCGDSGFLIARNGDPPGPRCGWAQKSSWPDIKTVGFTGAMSSYMFLTNFIDSRDHSNSVFKTSVFCPILCNT